MDSSKLAIQGGTPVRPNLLPYGRQWVDEEDIRVVTEVLQSDWLTTGPKVAEFERAVADFVGAREAVAVSNGTAALHAAIYALGIGPGDEVIVPPMTFAASANAVIYQGGTPVFADVEADTLLLDPAQVEAKITPRTRAIVAVDYAGQPCDYDALSIIAAKHDLAILADSCHALGARYRGAAVGTLADLSAFSFHPVKHITTGEGGMITTNDPVLAQKMRLFRNHGITSDHREREQKGSWFYEMVDLGYNYRLTDLQCALGINQLRDLPAWLERRQAIARRYDAAFGEMAAIRPLGARIDVSHAYHLYVVRLELSRLSATRADCFAALRAEGIGVNVHYVPVHLHPFYREHFGTGPGLCPVAEAAYEEILSLPIFPRMSDADVEDVITAMRKVLGAFALSVA
ncbi:MAG: UDP-4-amino-4,6-dideoxy-N-acetyl-beta-L-altrosamine transaminase [Ardenticatenales bacterium]|nr:UDP-4-amino-4,6-dideoxy-N-acetyl-beta-L-altrosamine transaminase [Ardenticatenales bacterium]